MINTHHVILKINLTVAENITKILILLINKKIRV